MSRRFGFSLSLIVIAMVAGTLFARYSVGQEQDPDSLSRRDFMRMKLNYTQNILEGLTTRDFGLIISGAEEVERITQAEAWNSNDFADYQKISDELRSVASHLKKAGQKSNLEAAALRYFELTMKCMDCHQYLRKADF
ncbi:MAG: hypothetical protein ACKO9H_05220 [Planctomycetota bacterium]|jgi:hypothetical protein